MRKTLLILLAISVSLFSCQEKIYHNDNEFNISSESIYYNDNTLSFNGESGNAVIVVTGTETSLAWGIKCPLDDNWCTFTKDGENLIISVSDNNSEKVRKSQVTIVIGENERVVSIQQDFLRYISLIESEMEITPTGGNQSLLLNTNIDNSQISVTSDSDWISDLRVSDGKLLFKAGKNLSQELSRAASITISYLDISQTLLVTQNPFAGYPYIIPIEGLEFDKYPVYEIWDRVNNIKLGELCEEFLYKPDVVKSRVKVAYPAVKGAIDYTKGFVVSNGGVVSWDSEKIDSYFQGELTELPKNLYIAMGESRISATELNLDESDKDLIITAECTPMTVVDTRKGAADSGGNTEETFIYTVQKIGTQYWMRENLKTTRFADGSPITTGISNTDWANMCKSAVVPACKINYSTTHRYLDANAPAAAEVRAEYGVNYNWAAIINQTIDVTPTSALTLSIEDKISPKGWSIPTAAEFRTLYAYLRQGSLSQSEYYQYMIETGSSELQNISGFSAKGGQWGSAKGGYTTGIYYGTLSYTFITPGSDANTTGHCENMASLRLDKTFDISNVNVGVTVYLRCIKK